MSRNSIAALAAALLLGTTPLHAQAPVRPKELKDADRFIASAMTTNDTTEKRIRYERALNPIQATLAKYPDNGAVWLAIGEVYASLHRYPEADSAFKKAVSIYPGYAGEINDDRIKAWGQAFLAGAALMDANDLEGATRQFQWAELMFDGRPESKLNLAAIYSNKGDMANAEKYFDAAIAAAEGPLLQKLQPEEQANWKRYAETARIALANVVAQKGIDAFNAEDYSTAITAFRKAGSLNSQARDHLYNLAESMYALARNLEAQHDSLATKKKVADAEKVGAQLDSLYSSMEPVVSQVREMDPNNEDLFILLMRSYRVRGNLTKDAAKKAAFDKQVNTLLSAHDAMTVEIANIGIPVASGDVTVRGKLTNLKLAAGAPVKLHFTLLGFDGSVVGETDATVTAPAPKATVEFSAPAKATKDVAGWKYVVVK